MSGQVLFACSKCFSRRFAFEELSFGQHLCRNCRFSTPPVLKCSYCRSEFEPKSKSQSACTKCEHNLRMYGKPRACVYCSITAAFGGTKCMRCAGYEAKYGPPVVCYECKQRSAFDKRDESKRIYGKLQLLCWLCTNSLRRALFKVQQEGRRLATKKRPLEKTHRAGSPASAKKSTRNYVAKRLTRSVGTGNARLEWSSVAAPAIISIDPNSTEYVVHITNLKERIANLEKRLTQKDKDLLEKNKQLTEMKGNNFEKESEMRLKLKENDRLHEMKVENLNKKVQTLLRENAALKRSSKKNMKDFLI